MQENEAIDHTASALNYWQSPCSHTPNLPKLVPAVNCEGLFVMDESSLLGPRTGCQGNTGLWAGSLGTFQCFWYSTH